MERNLLVDRLKGYACFLVLFGHVIMGVRMAGIHVPMFIWGLEQFIWSFHVALFLFLSGVVYHLTGEWRGKKTKLGFMGHKLLTLGVPYVVFSAVYVLINSFVGGANTQFSLRDILLLWKTPVAQYWFLYALLFLFFIWAVLSGVLRNWQITLLVVLIGYLLPFCGIGVGSFDMVFYSALAFGPGTFINFSRLAKPSTGAKWLVVAAHFAVATGLIVLEQIEAPLAKEAILLFGIYASIQFISLLQECKLVARFLDFMNKYSFQTYLLHTIFTAGIRVVLLRVGVAQWWIHVLLGTVFGLGCSVLAAKIAQKVWFLNAFFFPATLCKRKKELRSGS